MNDSNGLLRPASATIDHNWDYPVPHSSGYESEELFSPGRYVWLVRRNALKIGAAVLAVGLVTGLVCKLFQPVYEATTRIVIDEDSPSAAIGDQAGGLRSSDDQLINTEIQVIQSDAVLRPVAEKFHLTAAAPSGLRSWFSSWFKRSGSGIAPVELAKGEGPVSLSNLSVDRLPNNLLINIHYRSTNPREASAIANEIAYSYIQHVMRTRADSSTAISRFMMTQIDELKNNMNGTSKALADAERALGVIDPDQKTSILAARLLQLNTQYLQAQNERIRAETAYRQLHSGADPNQVASAALEISPQATLLGRQEERLHEAEEKLAVAKTVYGPNYAEYKRADNDVTELKQQTEQMRDDISKRIETEYHEASNREEMTHSSLQGAKDESDRLNANSAQYQELKREAESNTTLYHELFKKIKEAGINAGFQGSSIRVADEARPLDAPVFPQTGRFVTISMLLTLVFGISAVIISDLFDKTLRDPIRALKLTGVHVLGLLPHVQSISKFHAAKEDLPARARSALRKDWTRTEAFYRESILTLLSTIVHGRAAAKPKSLLLTSGSPGDGKSTCAAHLALAHAAQGKRTLLIDADLRSPFQHRYFRLSNDVGINGAISRSMPLQDIRQKVRGENRLDVVVAGTADQPPFHHVGNAVANLVEQAKIEGYELIVIDAPPMVGLAEPIEIASFADGVLVVGDAHRTDQRGVLEVLTTLERVNATVLGMVLNRFVPGMSEGYDRYQGYYIYAKRLTANAG